MSPEPLSELRQVWQAVVRQQSSDPLRPASGICVTSFSFFRCCYCRASRSPMTGLNHPGGARYLLSLPAQDRRPSQTSSLGPRGHARNNHNIASQGRAGFRRQFQRLPERSPELTHFRSFPGRTRVWLTFDNSTTNPRQANPRAARMLRVGMQRPGLLFSVTVCALAGLFLFIAHLAETASYRRTALELMLVAPLLFYAALHRARSRI